MSQSDLPESSASILSKKKEVDDTNIDNSLAELDELFWKLKKKI